MPREQVKAEPASISFVLLSSKKIRPKIPLKLPFKIKRRIRGLDGFSIFILKESISFVKTAKQQSPGCQNQIEEKDQKDQAKTLKNAK